MEIKYVVDKVESEIAPPVVTPFSFLMSTVSRENLTAQFID
jgi:hypothetical protein